MTHLLRSGLADKRPLPGKKECLDILRSHDTFLNVLAHSLRVRHVSLEIASMLKDPESINTDLLSSAALLHDIAKSRCIKTGERRHDLVGARILEEMGLYSIAEIVAAHVMLDGYDHKGPVNEKEIVFYADKRVMHDRIVSIKERVNDLIKRYGRTPRIHSHIMANSIFMLELEEKIQSQCSADILDIR